MTIAAFSPSCRSLLTSSAFVDSASPGRNDVDSFFSASENFPGRFVANEAKIAASQISATTHLARRPAGRVNSDAIRGLLPHRYDAHVSDRRSSASSAGSVTGAAHAKRSQT